MIKDGVRLSIKSADESSDHTYIATLSFMCDGDLFEIEDKRKNVFNTLITHRINGEIVYQFINNRVYNEKTDIPIKLKKNLDDLVREYLKVANHICNLFTHAVLYTDRKLSSNISKLHLTNIEQEFHIS